MQSSSREEVLSRIKSALNQTDLPPLRIEGEEVKKRDLGKLASQIKERCAEECQSLINKFEIELTRVGGKFLRCKSHNAASDYICELAKLKGTNLAVGWNSSVLDQPEIIASLKSSGIDFIADNEETSCDAFINKAIDAGLGISGVDFALAETGTLVLLSGEGKARSTSLLPPFHIALVKPDQFISGLDDLFPLLRHKTEPLQFGMSSAVTFITGPSRTADIELTLVVGVHGPQELHVIMLDVE